MTEISIIIPCYNAEDTIERCAASLFAQTIGVDKMELIFVNDASTDRTAEKLLALEQQYPQQVMIVNLEENGGQGAARNIGLSYAAGRYVGFVDADDYVEPDMYELLCGAAEEYGCDMAGGGYIRDCVSQKAHYHTIEKKATADVLPLGQPVFIQDDRERKRLILSGTATSFAARIYRLDMLRKCACRFPEGTLYEDNYWQSMVNLSIQSYYIYQKSFYHYVERAGSSSNHVTEANILQSMQVQCMLLEEYRRCGIWQQYPAEFLAKFYKSHCVMNLLSAYLEWGKVPEVIYRQMYEDMHAYGEGDFDNPYLWRSDIGLMQEMFGERRCGFERELCMKQYKSLLEKGKTQEWKRIFTEGSAAEKRHMQWKAYEESCFELGMNAQKFQKEGSFLEKAEALLKEAGTLGFAEEGTAYLEEMISHKGDYGRRYRKRRPILVYRGDATCYNVLDAFADGFIRALRERGKDVEVYDISKKGAEGLLELIGQTYQAIVGFQTYLFSVHLQDGRNLHDCIDAPKYHFIFDHPLWMKEHFEQGPKEYYILTHGRDYQEFVERYFYREVRKCYLLPPAGAWMDTTVSADEKRELGITFVGTWYDYRERLLYIKNTKGRERYLANRFLLIMKKNPNLRAEQAFSQALADYGIELADEDYKSVLFEFKQVCFAIMTYYREKIIRVLLENGLTIHVYGESWKQSPLSRYPNLICHPQVSVAESIQVWQNSKISLNIMSWHKGGFTERIANILLCGAVAVSDKSDYLTEHFTDGQDMVLFDLKEPQRLAKRLKELLSDDTQRLGIAERGQQKAQNEHTWRQRAGQFLELLEDE